MQTISKLLVFFLLLVGVAPRALAEPNDHSPHHIGGLLGLAMSFDLNADPDHPTAPGGSGLMLEARYTWEPWQVWNVSWFGLGGYAGLHRVTTDTEECDIRDCEVSTRIGYLGGRARLTAPIPWIAPFLETGMGASFGQFITRTRESRENVRGVRPHLPIAFGLKLGPRHPVEIGAYLLVHPGLSQSNGALAFGLSFALPHGS